MTDIYTNIIESIDKNDTLIEEGILRNIVMYGAINTFHIWLEKMFAGSKLIGLFNDIKKILYEIIEELDDLNIRFSEKYINKIEFENLLNDSIYNCMYNKENHDKGSDPGRCIINYFLNIHINILVQILKESIILMQDENINVSNVRNINDFQKIEINKDNKLFNLKVKIDNYINKLIAFLSSKQFNRYMTFSKMKKAILDAEFKIDKFREIDTKLMGIINIHDKNIKKIRTFSI